MPPTSTVRGVPSLAIVGIVEAFALMAQRARYSSNVLTRKWSNRMATVRIPERKAHLAGDGIAITDDCLGEVLLVGTLVVHLPDYFVSNDRARFIGDASRGIYQVAALVQ